MDSAGGASLHGELTFAELLQHVHQGSVPALATVSPDQSLLRAQSLMMSRDFSQLPVMSGSRSCQGAVTWASMAKALSRDACSQLKDCIQPAILVDAGDDVFGSIDKITAADFVLVRDETRQPYAIITTTDLAFAFETVTGPFLLLGVIEGLLRSVVEERLHVDRITAVQKFDVETERAVEGLTLGELASLIDNDDNWVRLGLKADPRTFREHLQEVVGIRQRTMHFRSASESPSDILVLKRMVQWLRHLLSAPWAPVDSSGFPP